MSTWRIPFTGAIAAPNVAGGIAVAVMVVALGLGAVGGCAPKSSGYNRPPTAVDNTTSPGGLAPRGERVAVVGEFRNPVKAKVDWPDVGRGVALSMALALLNDGKFDVWSNHDLAVEVERALRGPTHEREVRLAELHAQNEDVQYVITGQVTDFHYTSEVSTEARRKRWFGGRTEEAIVAIQFQLVDLAARRLVIADHVYGTAPIGQKDSQPVYENLAFGSYLFWNSPLGLATEQAIRNAMARIEAVVPTGPVDLKILEHLAGREVRITPGSILEGDELYVCVRDGEPPRVRSLRDRHTGGPLRVRITSAGVDEAEGWLLGEPPVEVDLRDAELRVTLPPGDDDATAAAPAGPGG